MQAIQKSSAQVQALKKAGKKMENKLDVKELHERLLVMAKAFHTICVENNLRYYMLGGTMLGAVRHKGFIPWDDDMDFGMPREDYNRFIEISKTKFPVNYELRFYINAEKSPMHYAKLIDNTTTLIEDSYHNYVEGLYIDIFPLDGAGSKTFADKLRMKRIHYYESLITNHCTTREKNDVARKLFKRFAKAHNLNTLHKNMERLMIKKSIDESEWVANYLGFWQEREIVPKEVMGVPSEYDFEDTRFFGPQNADAYLTSLYGDYMQLPPEEQRVFKHSFHYLDYHTAYRDYLMKGH